jgi:hypothetical protein
MDLWNCWTGIGVPIPQFDFVFTTSAVAAFSGNEQMAALAEMPGFGSRFVTSGVGAQPHGLPTLNVTDVASIDSGMRRQVLLFDWWILNFDRTDDNPNMLWDTVNQTLHVIDHNLAFDDDPLVAFWTDHIFRQDRAALSDAMLMANDLVRMRAILGQLPDIWSGIPESWTDVSELTLANVDNVLRRSETESFWHPQ